MKSGSRSMLKLKRKTDTRMRYGRITEVLQCRPSEVEEGIVYEEK